MKSMQICLTVTEREESQIKSIKELTGMPVAYIAKQALLDFYRSQNINRDTDVKSDRYEMIGNDAYEVCYDDREPITWEL